MLQKQKKQHPLQSSEAAVHTKIMDLTHASAAQDAREFCIATIMCNDLT